MALKREMLKALGLNDEQIQTIIEGHDETVAALKKERDSFKAKADAADALKAERDKLQQQLDAGKDAEDWKGKYESLVAANEKKETDAKLKAAFKALLKAGNIDERDHDLIVAGTNFDAMKLDKDGKSIKDADKVSEMIREKYADRVVTTKVRGADVKTPPTGGKVTRTKEEIMAIKDDGERQRAIAENHEMFGF